VLQVEDLGCKQASKKKNANLEIGVPGLATCYYPVSTIHCDTFFVKEKNNAEALQGQSRSGRGGKRYA
jgi:hypothetical protein